jgi:hypothetical protein
MEVLEMATPEAVVELPFIFVVTLVLLGLLVSLGGKELLPIGKLVLLGLVCAKQILVVHIPKIKNMINLIFITSPVIVFT